MHLRVTLTCILELLASTCYDQFIDKTGMANFNERAAKSICKKNQTIIIFYVGIYIYLCLSHD